MPHDDYVAHLLADLDADLPLVAGREIRTIFIGGGTPSLLSAEAMQTLMDGVRARIPVAADAEVTMEANPALWKPIVSAATRKPVSTAFPLECRASVMTN